MNRRKGHHSTLITDINELFVDACENGDYQTVAKILESIKDFNIDVTDNLGRTALRLAVENEHLEVVRILLNKSDTQKLREALLLAIYLGHTQIAESILKHPNYKVMNDKKFKGDDAFWQTPSSDDAQFSPDITPLILASQYKRTEIVQMLLLDGNRIIKPHDFQCKCNECSNKFKFDSLRSAQSRLNAYRGLCGESYISLASLDPLQTAFELGHELRILAEKEKYFKNEYLQLADNLGLYAVKLLNNVRGRDELEIILDKTGKENEEKYVRLARIDLALKYEEKPFVAHSNCQQKLVEIWYSGMRNISKMNIVLMMLLAMLFVVVLPFVCFIYIFAPNTKAGRFICQPCVKFVAHLVTYMGFIVMIISSSLKFAEEQQGREKFSNVFPNYSGLFRAYSSNQTLRYRFPVYDFYIRMQQPSNIDYAITIWVVGFLLDESKKIYEYGLRQYVLFWNNLFNFFMTILYLISFGLKYFMIILVLSQIKRISTSEFWNTVENLQPNDYSTQINVYETFYLLNDDRYYWDPYDPVFLSEGLFAIANIFSFTRFVFILPAIQSLGPLQITLGKMISDIAKFLSIFIIMLASFVVGLNNIFWYYQSGVRHYVEAVNHTQTSSDCGSKSTSPRAETSFSSMQRTFSTTFWALFGLSDGHEATLSPYYDNLLTEDIGSIIFGCFHITAIIILLNMLIAMMTKSYEHIREESDIEWKFARSKLYMEYIKEGSILPTPFNLIPTPRAIYKIVNIITQYCKRMKPNNNNSSSLNNVKELSSNGRDSRINTVNVAIKTKAPAKNVKMTVKENNTPRRTSIGGNDLTYTKVMQRIIKRYLLRHQKDDDEVNEHDLEEIKQDLQMLRYEVFNTFNKSTSTTLRSVSIVHNGIGIVGDEILKNCKSQTLSKKFETFKGYETETKDLIS